MAVMFPIPAGELNRIRTDVAAELLCDTATIYRRILTDDGAGGQTSSETSRGSFSCFVVQKPTEPADNAGLFTNPIDAKFYFAIPAPCETGDRITFDGDTYKVTNIDDQIMREVHALQVNS